MDTTAAFDLFGCPGNGRTFTYSARGRIWPVGWTSLSGLTTLSDLHELCHAIRHLQGSAAGSSGFNGDTIRSDLAAFWECHLIDNPDLLSAQIPLSQARKASSIQPQIRLRTRLTRLRQLTLRRLSKQRGKARSGRQSLPNRQTQRRRMTRRLVARLQPILLKPHHLMRARSLNARPLSARARLRAGGHTESSGKRKPSSLGQGRRRRPSLLRSLFRASCGRRPSCPRFLWAPLKGRRHSEFSLGTSWA